MRVFYPVLLCATVITHQAAAEEIVVTMSGANYAPSEMNASVGDTIRFVNDDGADHNVFVPTASHALDLGKQEPGSELVLTLRAPGTFQVECVFHSHMHLKVEVGT